MKLCDKYGIYLVDEANIESHGMGYGKENMAFHAEWDAAHLDRTYSLVERCRQKLTFRYPLVAG